MLVLIEGNEGTGKTTLIQNLAKDLDFVTIKYTKNMQDLYKLFDMCTRDNKIYVFDRGFISDLVYRIYDGEPGHHTLSEIGEICHFTKVIFCQNENAYKKAMLRGEDNITDANDHVLIESLFEDVIQMLKSFTRAKVMHYDYDIDSVNDVIKFIKK